jgi:hypothetical protein
MVKIQINLSKEENMIVELVKIKYSLRTKQEAIKLLVNKIKYTVKENYR